MSTRRKIDEENMISDATDTDPLVDHNHHEETNDSRTSSTNETAANTSQQDEWSSTLLKTQRYANILAHLLSITSVIVVIVWISSSLGGLSWQQQGQSKQVFNWHPLLMICAFSFMTVATLSFRTKMLLTQRSQQKLLHGIAWSVAAMCAFVALLAVFKSHNDETSGFIANLYSFHSWIGMTVIILYMIQFVLGILTFAWPLASMTPVRKARILQIHKFVGPFIYNATAATILLGIQEKESFIGCAYSVSEADYYPWRHFGEIPSVCKTSHVLGFLVLLVAFCTNLTLYDFRTMPVSSSQHIL